MCSSSSTGHTPAPSGSRSELRQQQVQCSATPLALKMEAGQSSVQDNLCSAHSEHYNEHWLLNGLTLIRNCPDAVWGFLYAYSIQTPRPATSAVMNRIAIIPEMLMGMLRSPVNNHSFIMWSSMQSFPMSHTHLGSNSTWQVHSHKALQITRLRLRWTIRLYKTDIKFTITLHVYVKTKWVETPLPWLYASLVLNTLKRILIIHKISVLQAHFTRWFLDIKTTKRVHTNVYPGDLTEKCQFLPDITRAFWDTCDQTD
jgi:hypothetical protein